MKNQNKWKLLVILLVTNSVSLLGITREEQQAIVKNMELNNEEDVEALLDVAFADVDDEQTTPFEGPEALMPASVQHNDALMAEVEAFKIAAQQIIAEETAKLEEEREHFFRVALQTVKQFLHTKLPEMVRSIVVGSISAVKNRAAGLFGYGQSE